MRLIDGDKVLDKMRDVMDMQDMYLPTHFNDFVINEMETVKAIPVEELKAILKEMRSSITKENDKLGGYGTGFDDYYKGYISAISYMEGAISERTE